MRMFLAENPDFNKNVTMDNNKVQALQDYNNNSNQYGQSPSQTLHAQTLEPGPKKTLLGDNRFKFANYAPVFHKPDPYEVHSQSNAYGSTMDTRKMSNADMKSQRPNRFGFSRKQTATGHTVYDDLNDREQGFDLDREIGGRAAGSMSGMPRASSIQPRQQSHSLTAAPRSQLISSAKMQLIGGKMQQPSATLHNTSSTIVLPYETDNPLIGYSEGERQRQLYKADFMKFALSQKEGSINDVKERSRSKSRRARYEAQRNQDGGGSIVDEINRTKIIAYPNRHAMKQRFDESMVGSQQEEEQPAEKIQLRGRQVTSNFQQAAQPGYQPSQLSGVTQSKELIEKEHRKAEYKSMLQAQINEKSEKKRYQKQMEVSEDVRIMNDYASFYRFGARGQGGGSPIRNRVGEIVSQHAPFTSQSQSNGGIEQLAMGQQQSDHQIQNHPQTSYDQTYNGQQTQFADTRLTAAVSTYSPKRQEIQHMKPSNMFEDITEDEFNRREVDKKSYQKVLFEQMNDVKDRKRVEKERIMRQELEDDAKIHYELNQMREAFRKEENPDQRRTLLQVASSADMPLVSHVDRSQSNPRGSPPRVQQLQSPAPQSLVAHDPYPFKDTSSFSPQTHQQQQASYPQAGQRQSEYQQPGNVFNAQMDHLMSVQREIQVKHNLDRIQSEKIVNDLMETNRRLHVVMSNSSPFSIAKQQPRNIQMTIETNPYDKTMSGNIRLESQFTNVKRNPQIAGGFANKNLSPGPGSSLDITNVSLEKEYKPFLRVNNKNALTEAKKSQINKLDDILDDFDIL